ncbi:MAG: hypothetical protein M1823_002226 [Watsoniomyces obsoletus]|nr:MAG: hypothetical protein M1823_002226 [Watsoniomyces obsoletus]
MSTSPLATVTITTSTVNSAYAPPSTSWSPPPPVKRDTALPSFVSQYPAHRVSTARSYLTVTPASTTTTTVRTASVTTTQTLASLCHPANSEQLLEGDDPTSAGAGVRSSKIAPWTSAAKQTALASNPGPTNPNPRAANTVSRNPSDSTNRTDPCLLGVPQASFLDTPTPDRYRYNSLRGVATSKLSSFQPDRAAKWTPDESLRRNRTGEVGGREGRPEREARNQGIRRLEPRGAPSSHGMADALTSPVPCRHSLAWPCLIAPFPGAGACLELPLSGGSATSTIRSLAVLGVFLKYCNGTARHRSRAPAKERIFELRSPTMFGGHEPYE